MKSSQLEESKEIRNRRETTWAVIIGGLALIILIGYPLSAPFTYRALASEVRDDLLELVTLQGKGQIALETYKEYQAVDHRVAARNIPLLIVNAEDGTQ